MKLVTNKTINARAASMTLFAWLNALAIVACALDAHVAYCGSTGALQYAHRAIEVLIISPHLGQANTCGSD